MTLLIMEGLVGDLTKVDGNVVHIADSSDKSILMQHW